MKYLDKLSGILFLILATLNSNAQAGKNNIDTVYAPGEVSRVDIIIDPDSLAVILAPGNEESYHEFPATFIFQNSMVLDTVFNIGFRLRGNTSRWSAKKSFKVSFNTFYRQKFYGLEKMNLNGEHNDPSIIRSRLSWELFDIIDIPASRAAYVEFYINNEYKGLYINVEHVDDEFVDLRFGNKSGNLFKCLWPADLVYLGDDPDLYKFENGDRRAYDLRTNEEIDDYSDLAEFIDVLNNTSDAEFATELEKVFNVNSFIKYLVIEILTGHWDAYSVNKNNFYLYNNLNTGKFEFIPYDLDNTFGIDWFGVDWGYRDIYNWSSDWEWRPLFERIMENDIYKDQFSYYMNKLLDEYFNNSDLFSNIDTIKSLIDPYVAVDPYAPLNYGWDFSDYETSFDAALGAHVTYGLKPYIEARHNSAIYQLEVNNIFPAYATVNQQLINENQTLLVSARIDDESEVTAKMIYEIEGSVPDSINLSDDGIDFDEEADDGIYTATMELYIESGVINYYLRTEDNIGQVSRYPREGAISIYINQPSVKLVINEFMASNSISIADNYGEFDDWVEIHNADNEAAFLGNKYLTDDLNRPDKWRLPSITLEPDEFFLIWTDRDDEQGADHTNFKLSKDGETIGIFENNNSIYTEITSLVYGPQQSDISSGTIVEGEQQIEILDIVSPNYSNTDETQATVTLNVKMSYQSVLGNFNPENDIIDVPGSFNNWQGSGQIFDGNDDLIYSYTLFNVPSNEHIEYKFRINENWATAEFPDGDNRAFDVPGGLNILTHWYNDIEDPNSILNQIDTRKEVVYWPNPVSNNLNYVCDFKTDKISIIDITGQIIINQQVDNQITGSVSLSNLCSGIYMICLYREGRLLNSERIIKL